MPNRRDPPSPIQRGPGQLGMNGIVIAGKRHQRDGLFPLHQLFFYGGDQGVLARAVDALTRNNHAPSLPRG